MLSGVTLIPDCPVPCQFGTSAGAEVDHRERKKELLKMTSIGALIGLAGFSVWPLDSMRLT